jgi:predicted ATPase with chaperone activity
MARTIADLDGGAPVITGHHVTEALLLRGSRALLLGEEAR